MPGPLEGLLLQGELGRRSGEVQPVDAEVVQDVVLAAEHLLDRLGAVDQVLRAARTEDLAQVAERSLLVAAPGQRADGDAVRLDARARLVDLALGGRGGQLGAADPGAGLGEPGLRTGQLAAGGRHVPLGAGQPRRHVVEAGGGRPDRGRRVLELAGRDGHPVLRVVE
ncbi:MAG: hypothetical protein LC779_15745 [Actinobacteria bacterium]|nr:hypothetical protein [Actinomycetota bacterium]